MLGTQWNYLRKQLQVFPNYLLKIINIHNDKIHYWELTMVQHLSLQKPFKEALSISICTSVRTQAWGQGTCPSYPAIKCQSEELNSVWFKYCIILPSVFHVLPVVTENSLIRIFSKKRGHSCCCCTNGRIFRIVIFIAWRDHSRVKLFMVFLHP